jgi:predicted permease
MDSFRDQLRQVIRRFARTPMFTAITLLTLAISIGANTAIFSVLEGVLLKPLPYPHPEQLIGVWLTAPGLDIKQLGLSPSTYFICREQSSTFQDIGIYDSNSANLTGVGDPERVSGLDVTDGTLPILGVQPSLGRMFTRDDDSLSAADTVILSYGYWRSKFGGDPATVGRNIMINGKLHQVIGILPKGFHFLDRGDPSIYLPMKWDRANLHLGNYSYPGVARLKTGATFEQASADVARMLPIINRSFPPPPGFSLELFEKAMIAPKLNPLKDDVIGDVGKLLWVLMGSIAIVLLIACANVANLLLVRIEGRQHELAIRAALGAGRGRIAGGLLFESMVLGLMGSGLGLALAYGALRVLVAAAPEGLPRLAEIGIDVPVLLFTLIISLFASLLFASLLFGAIPVFKYAGAQLGTGLREAGRGSSQTKERHRARSILVVVQVALAIVLMISSGLMIRTFRALTRVQPGFARPAEVQTFRISIPGAELTDDEQVPRREEEIMHKLEALPGVSSVAMSTKIPMDGNGSFDPVFAQDKSYAEGKLPPLRRFKFVSPGFSATIGTPLVAGRDFTWTDNYNKMPVAIVSENMARELWNDPANALGKRIRVSTIDDWREVVGVVGDVHDDGMNQDAPTSVYWPLLRANFESSKVDSTRSLAYAIRSPRAGSESFLKEIRQAVWSVDANLPLANVNTLDYYYQKSLARTSFTLIMLALAGGMALLLGVIGLYGVIAYSVSQRTREIGIRMALGAQQRDLVGMFVRHALMLAGVGVVCGVAAAFASMRLMSSLLFHVSPVDPFTYSAVSVCLVATAVFASYLPSRRAATVDPVDALRAE